MTKTTSFAGTSSLAKIKRSSNSGSPESNGGEYTSGKPDDQTNVSVQWSIGSTVIDMTGSRSEVSPEYQKCQVSVTSQQQLSEEVVTSSAPQLGEELHTNSSRPGEQELTSSLRSKVNERSPSQVPDNSNSNNMCLHRLQNSSVKVNEISPSETLTSAKVICLSLSELDERSNVKVSPSQVLESSKSCDRTSLERSFKNPAKLSPLAQENLKVCDDISEETHSIHDNGNIHASFVNHDDQYDNIHSSTGSIDKTEIILESNFPSDYLQKTDEDPIKDLEPDTTDVITLRSRPNSHSAPTVLYSLPPRYNAASEHSSSDGTTENPNGNLGRDSDVHSDRAGDHRDVTFSLSAPPGLDLTSPRFVTSQRGRGKTTAIGFVVTLVFVVSYLPCLSLSLARYFVQDFDYGVSSAGFLAYNLFVRSYFLNSVAKPLIYVLMNARFRQEVRRLGNGVNCQLSAKS